MLKFYVRFFIKIYYLGYIFFFQEVWVCWYELLLYLEKVNKWLNEVEFKFKIIENIFGEFEEIFEVLDVSCELI